MLLPFFLFSKFHSTSLHSPSSSFFMFSLSLSPSLPLPSPILILFILFLSLSYSVLSLHSLSLFRFTPSLQRMCSATLITLIPSTTQSNRARSIKSTIKPCTHTHTHLSQRITSIKWKRQKKNIKKKLLKINNKNAEKINNKNQEFLFAFFFFLIVILSTNFFHTVMFIL